MAENNNINSTQGHEKEAINVEGLKASLQEYKSKFDTLVTMSEAPTSSTLTYTHNGKTYSFKIGDEVRVPDADNASEGANGYVYYKLYDIQNGTAYWDLGGSGGSGGGALGKVKVYLKDIINEIENLSPSFAGVVVTLQNTTDSGAQPVTKTIAAGETSCTFTKVTPLKDYSVSVSALDSQHTTPAAQTITNLGIGDERELTFRYEADEYTAQITSNQGASDEAVSGAWLRASYTLDGQTFNSSNLTNGQTWKVPHGVTLSVSASSNITHYSKQTDVDTTNKLLTAAYSTTKVNLQMVGVVSGTEGAFPTGAQGTVKYSGGADQVLEDNTSLALVPTGTAFVIDYAAVASYGTPANYSSTAAGTAMTAAKAAYTYGMLTIDVTNNDEDDTDLAKVKVYITIGSGSEEEVTGTIANHVKTFQKAIVPGTQYSVRYDEVEGYDTPATVSGTMPAAGTETLTAQYATTLYTVTITSNQTNDSTIAAKRATLSYTYGGVSHQQTDIASGASVKVSANGVTNLVVTADDVTGYAKSVSNVGTAYTVSYTTMRLAVALTYQGETAPDLTGVTITVTDTTSSTTIAKTDGVYLIPSGDNYKVEVSNDVEGYAAPDAATGTATSTQDASATVTMTYEEQAGFVDLGLPSGKKWAIGNLVKDSQGNYSIGEETDWGTYVSWGNIIGHNEGEGYDFSSTNYNSTPGYSVAANIPSNDAAHDIALATLGTPWHLPTKEDFQELYDNTDSEWTTINGVAGRKFMKKSDHSVYVFFPASGRYDGTSLDYRGTDGNYWSASFYDSTNAYLLDFDSSYVYPQNRNYRYRGLAVRPVQSSTRKVTITVTGDNVEGVSLTLTDSDGTRHTATTDALGTAVFTSVAYGTATLSSNDFGFSPNTVTVSASAGSFTVEMSLLYIDLGLPSGLKWATGNLLKSGNVWQIADNETDYGDFWSWGNIGDSSSTGYMPSSGGTMTESMYNSTTGHNLTGDIPVDAAYDVPRNRLGYPWRLPTRAEFQELIANTDNEWTTINGIKGRKFMKKTDNSVYVFFPGSGYCNSSGLINRGSYGRYWSSTYKDSSNAYNQYFNNSNVGTYNSNSYCGLSIRPVQSSKRTVTITVTGSTIAGVNITLTDSEGTRHAATTDVSGTAEFTLVAYGSAKLSADGKEFTPSTITVSASSGAFTVEMSEAPLVDLGLPSGLKWAQGNIVKNGENYEIGAETDYGAYFSWGNIVPHFSANSSTFDDGYDFGTSNSGPYASTPGKQVSANIASNDAQHDAALALLGSPWRLPTKEEFQELYDNTDREWTTINGINGWKFMKKTDHSVFVFFPAAGFGRGTSINNVGSYGFYRSSSWKSADNAYAMFFNSSSVTPQNNNYRYNGFSVRAVQ